MTEKFRASFAQFTCRHNEEYKARHSQKNKDCQESSGIIYYCFYKYYNY
jgi:hypothetical protein